MSDIIQPLSTRSSKGRLHILCIVREVLRTASYDARRETPREIILMLRVLVLSAKTRGTLPPPHTNFPASSARFVGPTRSPSPPSHKVSPLLFTQPAARMTKRKSDAEKASNQHSRKRMAFTAPKTAATKAMCVGPHRRMSDG